jgi:hypothetical protein
MAQHYVYRFYAELKDYKPKIWRRFEINGEKSGLTHTKIHGK